MQSFSEPAAAALPLRHTVFGLMEPGYDSAGLMAARIPNWQRPHCPAGLPGRGSRHASRNASEENLCCHVRSHE
jgi:hypothetical protein